jgi:hypothetical protein
VDRFVGRRTVMRIRWIKHVPGYPVIPFVPVAILVASLAMSIGALVGVRRLQRRLGS